MDEKIRTDKQNADHFAEPAPSANLSESATPCEPMVPCRPNPSIKFRHSAAIQHAPSEEKPKPASKRSKKKSIALVLGLFVVAFIGMVANILMPMISYQYFPSKWVADFRSARGLSEKDWTKGKTLMLAAMSDGKKENAPIGQQMSQKVFFGQTLENHGDLEEASQIFQDVSLTARNNNMPDKEGLALLYKSECAHLAFLTDFKKLPDPEAAERALLIFQKQAPDKTRQAFAELALGQINGDLGNKDKSDDYFKQAESVWSQDKAQLSFIAQNRWRAQMVTNIRNLPGQQPGQLSALGTTAVYPNEDNPRQEKNKAIALLDGKNFAALEALFKDERAHRKQLQDGSEKTNYLYDALGYLRAPTDSAWQQRLGLLKEWRDAYPNSVTPHIALANFYNHYARQLQYSNKGKQLTAEQIYEFRQRHLLGAMELGEALKHGPLTPDWFSTAMVNFAANSDRADKKLHEKLMASGVAAFPDYMPILLKNSLYLQYFGAPGEWLKYVTDAANKKGGADGDKLYARLVGYTHSAYPKIYKENPTLSNERVSRGYMELRKNYFAQN